MNGSETRSLSHVTQCFQSASLTSLWYDKSTGEKERGLAITVRRTLPRQPPTVSDNLGLRSLPSRALGPCNWSLHRRLCPLWHCGVLGSDWELQRRWCGCRRGLPGTFSPPSSLREWLSRCFGSGRSWRSVVSSIRSVFGDSVFRALLQSSIWSESSNYRYVCCRSEVEIGCLREGQRGENRV